MDCASSFAFVQRDLRESVDLKADAKPERADTNVISINFSSLKAAEENIQMGDPYFCRKCKSCLYANSKLYIKSDYMKEYSQDYNKIQPKIQQTDDDDDEEEVKVSEDSKKKLKEKLVNTPIGESHKVWICEFCGTHNALNNLDLEEIPKSDDAMFLLQSAQKLNKSLSNLQGHDSESSIIFCIDNSGSMSVTHEIQGKNDGKKHGLSEQEYEMLKQFIEEGALQDLPGQNKNTAYVSRKEIVLAAIEEQLINLKKEFPNRKVGLVTFDNKVCVIGDGQHDPEIVTGDKLYSFDVLHQIGLEMGKRLVTQGVKDSADNLLAKFASLKENGRTALGPGLLIALGLALQAKQGSKVILCTDGLANIGLGEMDSAEGRETAEEFYGKIVELAKARGVSISVISIKGEGCKLEVIGKLAEETSGTCVRVDPQEIKGKFANILKKEIVGTQLEVKLRLHPGVKFRNEKEEHLSENGSLYRNVFGNVTKETKLMFEYQVRSRRELEMLGIDFRSMDTVTFQAQIIYTSTKGHKLLRVISKTLKTTDKIYVAEENADVEILATKAMQRKLVSVKSGDVRQSKEVDEAWGTVLKRATKQNSNPQEDEKLKRIIEEYELRNKELNKVSEKRSSRSKKQSQLKDVFKDEISEDVGESNAQNYDDEDYEALYEASKFGLNE